MQHSSNLFLVSILLSCLVIAMITPSVHSASTVDAGAKITEAQTVLRIAFQDVLDAEKNGVNVTQLDARLTDAGALLSEAEVALNGGNITGATALADSCITLADGVEADARALKAAALAGAGGWWFPIILSLVGSGAFLVALHLVWRWFRKYYVEKLVRGRPEVPV